MSSRGLQRAIENKNPTLELKIVSASNISHIDATDKIDSYAVVTMINGDTSQKKQAAKTPIDYDGGSNPTWNHTVKFSVNEERAREGLSTVTVKLYSYWLEGESDLYLGEVNVSVQELLDSDPFDNGNVNKMKSMTYPIKFIGETKPNAKLNLSYRFKPVPVNDLYPHYQPQEPVYTNLDPATSGQAIMYSPQVQTTTTTVKKLTIELVIKSAKDIKNVNVFDDMDVYASVMICEDKTKVKHKTKTPIAYSGFKFPSWNHAVKFSFDREELAREERFSLVVELMSHRPLLGDKHIGKVNVGIKELMASNKPSPLPDGKVNSMKLVTHKVRGVYGEQGTLSFAYRFLDEQVTIPNPNPQPVFMYVPVPYPSHGSSNPVHGTSGYMAMSSNGLVPVYMPSTYQLHGYQQYSVPQPQLQPHMSQPQQQSQQQHVQLLISNKQSQSRLNKPHEYHQYSPMQHQPQPQPTQPQMQKQGAWPQVKPQGGSIAAVGLGAAVLGRVIGGALMSDMMMSDEVNIFEVEP